LAPFKNPLCFIIRETKSEITDITEITHIEFSIKNFSLRLAAVHYEEKFENRRFSIINQSVWLLRKEVRERS